MEKASIAIDDVSGGLLTWYDASNRECYSGRSSPELSSLKCFGFELTLITTGPRITIGTRGSEINKAAENWTVVAAVPDIPSNGLLEVHFGRHVILLVNSGHEIRAFQGLCPHQLARLGEGMLVDGMVQCPRHLARFDLADGSCSGGWQLAPLRRYEVRIDNGNVLLKDPLVALE